ncbi:MAG: phosphatase PAP2 family protein [Acidobacteriota bacterium]
MKLTAVIVLMLVSAARTSPAQTSLVQGAAESPALFAPAPPRVPDPAAAPAGTGRFQPDAPPLFRSLGPDLKGFFSSDTAKILGAFAVAGLSVRPIDTASVEDARERLPMGVASVGNLGGGLLMQAGGGFATYLIGRTTGRPRLASLGGDLVRAQALSQLFVQGTKFAVARQRPDASNSLSFPSGHSASAFATATVIQQHLGWKFGAPAYAFAGLVGASRMASSRHYLSDVVIGAGIGLAAGRTVTLHLGRERFAIAPAPTPGGAMITFIRH